MPIVADAAVAVRGDLTPFKKDLNKAGAETQKLGKKLDNILSPKNLAAGFLGGAAVAGITNLMSNAINDASDLAESMGKVNVVFGEGSEEVNAWAENAAEAFGQSKQQALEAAGTYGNLFQAFGIGQEKAQQMSMTLVELAADLASFNNTSVDDALLALRSGLSGETEPLKRYGIAINDARLRTELAAQGVEDLGATLTAEQKAVGAYALIMQDSALAIGDFERTSDGLANQQRILAARLENVSAEMGERLLPIVLEFVSFINDVGIPALKGFMDLLSMESDSAGGIPILGEIEAFLNAVAEGGTNFSVRLRQHMTGEFDETRRVMDAFGIDFLEASQRIRLALERSPELDRDQIVDRMVAPFEDGARELATTVPENIRAAAGGWDAAAEDLADGLPEAMEEAKEEAEEVARSTPGSLANQLREGIDDYDDALDELAEVAENSVSDLAERQKIEGILASKELTDALNSDSTRTRLLAMELVNDLVSDYELLAPGALRAGSLVNPGLKLGILSNLGLATQAGEAVVNAAGDPLLELPDHAYDWGYNTAYSFARGMTVGRGLVVDAARQLAQDAANPITINSEPPDHGSALYGITKWGGNIVKTIADGIYANLGMGSAASHALSGVLVPDFGTTPALAGAVPGAAVPAGGGPTYVINVNGVQKTVSSAEEAMEVLRDLGAFSEGRLNG